MGPFYLVSVTLHIVAAAAWIGGMIFFAAVVVPSLRDPSTAAAAPAMLRVVGARYRAYGWITVLVLVATGTTNLLARGLGWTELSSASFWSIGFGRTLAWKLAFVALVIAATGVHDVWMGPRAMQTVVDHPDSDAARRLRKRASYLGRATLLLSLVVIALAVQLVRAP